jgi:hypothetical protein
MRMPPGRAESIARTRVGSASVPSAQPYEQANRSSLDKQKLRKDRMARLESGCVEGKRADRWAVRRRIARMRLGDWILYGIYEHLSDLAAPVGTSLEPQVRLYFWELAEDFHVSRSTIARRIGRLEKIGLLKVKRTTSKCSPNTFTLLKPVNRTLTFNIFDRRT